MRRRVTRSSIALIAGLSLATAAACSTDGGTGQDQPGRSVTVNPTGTLPPASTIAGTQPVLAVDIVQGLQRSPVEVRVAGDDGVAVTFRELTIEPGSSTGEHCHHGQLIAVVKQGVLTHYADIYPEGHRIYRAGSALVEDAGYVHEGRNEGVEDVVLMITYITPVGKPLSETDLTECEPEA